MKVETRTDGSWQTLVLDGELDLATSERFRAELIAAIEHSPHVAIDLRSVRFMDSSALGVIVQGMKRARERDGDLALIGPTGSPRKVLAITALDRVVRIVDDPTELDLDGV